MTYSSKTPCPDRVLPSTTVWFFQRETKQSLHTPHSTLHTALFALQTSNFTLHTSHFTLHTASFTLQTSHFTLHTALFALQTETSHFTLHTSHSTLHTSHFRRNRRTAEVDHRGSGTDFVWKNIRFRASAISQKRISCETSFKTPSATPPPTPLALPFALRERSYSCKSQWNSIGNSSTSTTCNPIYIAGTILQLQITMNSVDRTCTKSSWNPIYNAEPIRAWSEHDPRMIRPHTRPSRTRRTAEVDHRGSGTDFVWKNIGFRASAISQKRISCETSFKTPSATPPPTPLAMPFALRERSYSCKSQWNSIGNSSTSTTCNPIYIAGTILQLQIAMEFCRPHMHEKQLKPHLQCGTDPRPIRAWSENDPTTHETVSQPSHRRGRSSRFGDGLCMEKHRLSCICYLSKTHFVRDFLQNSIGNSSTSTTCNPIYSEGTTLATPFTMRERSYSCKSQWNSVDRTCTKNSWNPIYNAEPIREWSENDPSMIREWSDHTRDRLATVAPQR